MSKETQHDLAALILRLGLGVMFIAHGLLKVLVFTMPGTVKFFASTGFAGWMAYPVTALEIGGGILLLLGIASRWVSLSLIPVLLGAWYVHAGYGWLFTNTQGGWEFPAFLTVATIVMAVLGSGRYAVRLPFVPAAAQ